MQDAIIRERVATIVTDSEILAEPVPAHPVIEEWDGSASLYAIRHRAGLLNAIPYFSVQRLKWVLDSRPQVAA